MRNRRKGKPRHLPAGMSPEQFFQARWALGMTQAELAECMGLSCGAIQDWERGLTVVPKYAVVTMAALELLRDVQEQQEGTPE